MGSTILSDELINPTELRNNQKKWLDKAYINPISIMSGEKQLVLLNRDSAKHMYSLVHFAEIVIRYCKERESGKKNKSGVFPWIKHLNENEIEEFHKELLSSFEDAMVNKNWLTFDEMLDSWVATAEAKSNPEMVELLTADLNKEKFTRVK